MYLYHWPSPGANGSLDLNAILNIVCHLEPHNPHMTNNRKLKAMDTVGIGSEVVECSN